MKNVALETHEKGSINKISDSIKDGLLIDTNIKFFVALYYVINVVLIIIFFGIVQMLAHTKLPKILQSMMISFHIFAIIIIFLTLKKEYNSRFMPILNLVSNGFLICGYFASIIFLRKCDHVFQLLMVLREQYYLDIGYTFLNFLSYLFYILMFCLSTISLYFNWLIYRLIPQTKGLSNSIETGCSPSKIKSERSEELKVEKEKSMKDSAVESKKQTNKTEDSKKDIDKSLEETKHNASENLENKESTEFTVGSSQIETNKTEDSKKGIDKSLEETKHNASENIENKESTEFTVSSTQIETNKTEDSKKGIDKSFEETKHNASENIENKESTEFTVSSSQIETNITEDSKKGIHKLPKNPESNIWEGFEYNETIAPTVGSSKIQTKSEPKNTYENGGKKRDQQDKLSNESVESNSSSSSDKRLRANALSYNKISSPISLDIPMNSYEFLDEKNLTAHNNSNDKNNTLFLPGTKRIFRRPSELPTTNSEKQINDKGNIGDEILNINDIGPKKSKTMTQWLTRLIKKSGHAKKQKKHT